MTKGNEVDPDTVKHLQDADGSFDAHKMDGWHLSVQKIMGGNLTNDEKLEMLLKAYRNIRKSA